MKCGIWDVGKYEKIYVFIDDLDHFIKDSKDSSKKKLIHWCYLYEVYKKSDKELEFGGWRELGMHITELGMHMRDMFYRKSEKGEFFEEREAAEMEAMEEVARKVLEWFNERDKNGNETKRNERLREELSGVMEVMSRFVDRRREKLKIILKKIGNDSTLYTNHKA